MVWLVAEKVQKISKRICFPSGNIQVDPVKSCGKNIAKLSIVGAGMMSNPGVAAKMFESLYNEGVNINMIATSEIRVTVLINEKDGVRAMNAVHDAFNLAD